VERPIYPIENLRKKDLELDLGAVEEETGGEEDEDY
jgi:hypothetical protein